MKYLFIFLSFAFYLSFSFSREYKSKQKISITGVHQVSFQSKKQTPHTNEVLLFSDEKEATVFKTGISTNDSKVNIMGHDLQNGDKVYIHGLSNFSGEIIQIYKIKEV